MLGVTEKATQHLELLASGVRLERVNIGVDEILSELAQLPSPVVRAKFLKDRFVTAARAI
jgi:hypothetical protein